MAPVDYDDDDLPEDDTKYHESSDDDFDPESAPADQVSSSEDDDDNDGATVKPTQKRAKRKAPVDEELDSGDEVTIQAARRKRSKKGKKGSKNDDDDDLILSDDEGDEGGLIKTRAQRLIEVKERRPLARTEGATVDVDALWAQMTAAPLKPVETTKPQEPIAQSNEHAISVPVPAVVEEEELITVNKTYTFAGQDTTEEKQIPRSQLDKYVSDGWKPQGAAATIPTTEVSDAAGSSKSKIRRPLRRPTRFDPNLSGYVRALPPEYQLSWPRQGAMVEPTEDNTTAAPEVVKTKETKATKLNVVDKSRMDWTGFVDKEGIAEELDTHGKTKEAYLGRMQFLAGVEARREEERRNAKLKASATAS